ncbi:hypothetical protein LCGC14_0420400 [marine sediment metagenome]|uniref:Uncharacterized protein n=1 Tax=marine sediment metagenome TaxID=412755 RepID=A0A0F9VD21_9ZZZZ
MMIRVLFKFAKLPSDAVVIDTTSNSGDYKDLSPFVLSAPPAKRFENLWQFSKVYKKHIMSIDGYPDASWYKWRDWGYSQDKAYRYPMGKGAIPEYSLWDDKRLSYIEARKKIYAPIYAENVFQTSAYEKLCQLYTECSDQATDLILLDYDAYDHLMLGMTLIDVINNPNKKMGHAFVLLMMLTDMLEVCLKR